MRLIFLILLIFPLSANSQISRNVYLGAVIEDSILISKKQYVLKNDSILSIEKGFKNNYSINENSDLIYWTNKRDSVVLDTMIINTNNQFFPKTKLIFCSVVIDEEKEKDSLISQKSTNTDIALFPVPVKPGEEIYLRHDTAKNENENLSIKLYAINGALVKEWREELNNTNTTTLQIPDVSNGVYILLILNEDTNIVETKRLIIK